jgi:hypothetical protein
LLSSDFPQGCVRCEMQKCRYFNCVAAVPEERVWAALRGWGLEAPRSVTGTDLRATGS